VTVQTQPSNPSQTCTVTNGSGTLAAANITNVSVTCATNTYTVGGSLSGLAAGATVVLQNNAGDDLSLTANGSFTFATALADLSAYAVTVQTQPSNPSQTCTVTNGSGTLAAANVTNVSVTCATNTYTVGGSLSGLASGTTVELQNSAGDDLSLTANGSFTFATALASGSTYLVTVAANPTNPSQTCAVSNGSGTLAGANITNVSVTCATNTYTVGGTVTGLTGSGLMLQNNGSNDLAISADGSFVFATALASGSTYAVTVLTQPSNPSQTCSVSNGSGTLAGANVTNVSVTCATNTYTVGGSLSGLATGTTVVLQNNAGDDLAISADGSFTFTTTLASGSTYLVTVAVNPTNPSQTCTVTNGSGTLAGANITNVSVACLTDRLIVTPIAGFGGALSPATPQLVDSGSSTSFEVIANAGYQINTVAGTCGGTLAGTTYTTLPITTNCTVNAMFTPQTTSVLLVSPNPTRLSQMVTAVTRVSGTGAAPAGGGVTVVSSTGEVCTSNTPSSVVGNTAEFTCPLTFTALGTRQLTSTYSGSGSHAGSASAAVDLRVLRFSDLSVSVNDTVGTVSAGDTVDYLVQVSNVGPESATGVALSLVADPSLVGATWTCAAIAPAICPAASGIGEISQIINVPVGGILNYMQNGQLRPSLPSTVIAVADISVDEESPNFGFDPVSSNNQAIDTNLVELIFFRNGFE
jgi:flagellar motor switch/type III secretory pathway protein FliN